MRKIHEILRLHFEAGLSGRPIAAAVGVALSTVQEGLRRFADAGLGWPTELDPQALEARLYPPSDPGSGPPLPDFAQVLKALRSHKAMTRQHLWQQYRDEHADGLGYSAFCAHLARFAGQSQAVMRTTHAPGAAMLVDYAGPSLYVVDRHSGERRAVRLFVAVLGYSNYTFAMATEGETTADWLSAQAAALHCFGGVPESIIPDNPKALVSRACRYEPVLNPAYQDFARHYQVAILPARVRKPRDKAKVETAVQIVERLLMPTLLAQNWFSLAELNQAIAAGVAALNQRPFQKLDGCRASWFEHERAALKALPPQAYEFAQWKQVKVGADYHIEVDGRAYSVPHRLIGERLEVRISAACLEVFRAGKLVATHRRVLQQGGVSTLPEHRPAHHRAYADRSLEKLQRQAQAIGPNTLAVLQAQTQLKKHPHESWRVSLGILRLAQDFDAPALERACGQALALRSLNYRAIRGLIEQPPFNRTGSNCHYNQGWSASEAVGFGQGQVQLLEDGAGFVADGADATDALPGGCQAVELDGLELT